MKGNKQYVIVGCIVAFIAMSMALPAKQYNEDRNLKVLPNDITDEKLDSIMGTFNLALGVNCSFCHAAKKGIVKELDFASDAEPMKENARNMLRMNIEINKKYFYFDKAVKPEYLNMVTCKTCHRGEAIPPQK